MLSSYIIAERKSRNSIAANDPLRVKDGMSKRLLAKIMSDVAAHAIFHPRHVEDTQRLRSLMRTAVKSEEVSEQ